jgi:anti-sigma regulatory factor (Ser/Thr protein kinase)
VSNAERSFGCDHTVPSAARAWTRLVVLEMLPAAPESDDIAEDLEIVVSELVTNAVLAGCAATRLVLSLNPDCLRVDVLDDAPGWPTEQDASPADDHGRGLAIVSALASRWGVRRRTDAKEVWAEFDLPTAVAKRLP